MKEIKPCKDTFFVIPGREPVSPTDPLMEVREHNLMHFKESINEILQPYSEMIALKAALDHGETRKTGSFWSKSFIKE